LIYIALPLHDNSVLSHARLFAMEPSNYEIVKEEPRYVDFPCIEHGTLRDGKPVLNRWSSAITKDHDFPGAQAMLYAAGVPNKEMMKTAPQVGVATVWWEGNPCK
jgi:dihydroxy-acid dehydratase